jgi:hypothetical protein
VPDPNTKTRIEEALAEARGTLRLLFRLGALKAGIARGTKDDDLRAGVRIRLILDSAKDPQYREWPDNERDYLLKLLSDKPPKLPKKGRRPNEQRDFWIVQMVARLVHAYHLAPTRNRESATQMLTACGIVAQVLSEFGVALSEVGVETVWSRRQLEDVEFDVLSVSSRLPPEYRARLDAQLARRRKRMLREQPPFPVRRK